MGLLARARRGYLRARARVMRFGISTPHLRRCLSASNISSNDAPFDDFGHSPPNTVADVA